MFVLFVLPDAHCCLAVQQDLGVFCVWWGRCSLFPVTAGFLLFTTCCMLRCSGPRRATTNPTVIFPCPWQVYWLSLGRIPFAGLTPTVLWGHRGSPHSLLGVPPSRHPLARGVLSLLPTKGLTGWRECSGTAGACLKVQALAEQIYSWDGKPLTGSWHCELCQADSLCLPSSLKCRQGCSTGQSQQSELISVRSQRAEQESPSCTLYGYLPIEQGV